MSDELPERSRRAIEEQFIIYKIAEDLFLLRSQSGNWYNVDLGEQDCDCPDATYRNTVCKHQRACAVQDEKGQVVEV